MSMKALCLAAACISVGLGDLIVIIVAESNFFQNRVSKGFCYELYLYICASVCVLIV